VSTATTSDAELLRRWQSGDAVAGNVLVRRHVATLYRFFSNKLPERVDDLAQQTFAACLAGADRFDDQRSFPAYLVGIARNMLLRELRRMRRSARAIDLEAGAIDTYVGSASGQVALDEERALLLAALRRIPLGYQLVLELYYWEGMRTPEIANVLEASEGTVRSRLTRGRALLRAEIEAMPAAPVLRASTITNLESWARSLRETIGTQD
jgi:RNA polymerase sigma-70 factor (ECF subfamily)